MSGNGTSTHTFSEGKVLPDTLDVTAGGNSYKYASNLVGGKRQGVTKRRGRKERRRSNKHAGRKSRAKRSKKTKSNRKNKLH
jgi:hypothetical protein